MVPIGERAIVWREECRSDVRPQFVVEPDEGVLFSTVEGDRFSPNGMTSLVRNYVLAADLEKRGGCHLFRHAMATQMLETTQIYTQVSIRRLHEIHRAMHPTSKQERTTSKAIAEPEAPSADDLIAALEAETTEERE